MPPGSEAAYFANRADQSRAARAASSDAGARLAHSQLETAYEALASRPPAFEPDPFRAALTSDRVMQGDVALHIRPAAASDQGALIGLFSSVSAEDLRFRFGGTSKGIGARELAPLLESDATVSMTFLAFVAGKLIATSTLADTPGTGSAEIALSVHSSWKCRGVAKTLLEHTLAYAKAHGLREVISFESGDDRAAINLEREMGFVARLISANPVELSLSKIVADD